MSKHRTRTALAAAIAVVATGSIAAAPAAAQAPDTGDFVLRKTNVGLTKRVAALDKYLDKSGVQQLLAEANRPTKHNGRCHRRAFGKAMPAGSQWFCFTKSDAGNGKGRVEWIPQGVTTVADAQQNGLWGNRQALLVSWYDDAVAPKKGVRVTFLDPNTKRYRHVLLVYPYIRKNGWPSYEAVGRPQGGIHAGGVLWYGNYLYVVDTRRGIRVFDMRYIFDLHKSSRGRPGDTKHIGWGELTLRPDVYRGYGYRYVMPQVDAWVNDAGPDNSDKGNRCAGTGAPKFSYISLDRSEVPERLITGEYCGKRGDVGRVARWPLDGTSGTLLADQQDGRVHATDAHRLAANQIQGAVSYGGQWYLSRSTGKDDQGNWRNGRLITAQSNGGSLQTLGKPRRAGVGPEDLSFWPAQNELWTVTEHEGQRMLYGVPR